MMEADTTTPPVFTFHHAELGVMTGIITPNNVVQFRAIPYATIPARFKRSILLETPVESDGNFTEHGFACAQAFAYDKASCGGPSPGEVFPPPSDEFKCLLLQINVPIACLRADVCLSKLPVLVYIHGGGFVLGHIDEQHNTASIVEQSVLDSQPIISVSIQYRLGALGYLHTPGHENLALNDQRNALRWIQKFIGGFGGDRERVTVFGESAGSMSICAHMLSPPPAEGPLFQTAILMSGSLGPMTAPASIEMAEKTRVDFMKRLGIEEQAEDGLAKLRKLDVAKIIEVSEDFNNNGRMWLTVQDPQWFGKDAALVTWEKVPELIGRCEWVKEIVLGTTGFEGTMFMPRLANITPKAFLKGINQQLGSTSASLISRSYSITQDMDQNLFITKAMQWIGDVVFEAPNHALAKYLTTHTNKTVYRYVFDVRNPFPNHAMYQQAHHWVDIYFVFKTLQFRYPTQWLRDISTKHAQLWIDFANGKAPWMEYKYTDDGDGVILVADDRQGWVERTAAEHEVLVEWGWGRCEALWESWKNEMGRAGFKPMDIEPLKGKPMT